MAKTTSRTSGRGAKTTPARRAARRLPRGGAGPGLAVPPPADEEVAVKATPASRSAKPKAAKAAKAAKPKAAKARRPSRASQADDDGTERVAGAGKSLVVVESPAKSRTLNKFLGRNFTVLASNGHVMDLPKSKLGVDLENDFEPEYEPIRSKNAALAKIQTAAAVAERIYLAPDPDREGEAIAWHLATVLKPAKRPLQRLTFNEITQRAVQTALENPRDIDMNLVNAQQARRVLDRLVGYKVSPFLWKTMFFGLSAGRVQSVALRILCEREDEIDAFVPEEYWTLEADFETAAGGRFTARLWRIGEDELESGRITGATAEATARGLAGELASAAARVAEVQTAPRLVHPKPPFITSTLQQTAFNRLGFGSQRTMKIAQNLYEGIVLGGQGSVGLITYMRTDSPRLADEAIGEMRAWLTESLGPDYVPESPRQFKGKKSAQDAHEAVRPTSIERTPESVRAFLSEEQWKLYDLIWKRAVASQASPAEYLATTIEVEAGRLGLRATGRVLKFAGFQKLYGMDEEDEKGEKQLPEVAAGTPLQVSGASLAEDQPPVRPDQHFTQPPPRYTEASLVKKLEEENIGRPSTYATIVTTITARQYVLRDKGRLIPTELGRKVTRLLVGQFPDVFEVGFTASMEDELDGIEEGKQEWHTVVRDLWKPLSRDLDKAMKKVAELRQDIQEPTDIDCPNCGRKLVKKFGRRGPFLSCPGWPKCKYSRPIDDAELPQPIGEPCPECGADLVERHGRFGRFISCSTYPDCKYTRDVTLGIKCPKCGLGEVVAKRSKRGKAYYTCSRRPECDFVAFDKPRLTPCPTCGAPFLVEKETKKGLTLRCLTCKSVFQPETVGA